MRRQDGPIHGQLTSSINSLQWSQVTVIFIMMVALVLAAEWVFAKVRGAIQ